MIPSVRDLVTPFLNKEELARIEHLINDIPKITEVFEKLTDAYPFKAKSASTYSFKSVGEPYIVDIYQYDNRIGIDFGVGKSYDTMTYPETNAGDIYRVMATVIAIAKDYISKHSDVEIISWSSVEKKGKPKIGETQRDRIYKLLVKKQFGIDDKDIVDRGDGTYWAYIKGRNGISEEIVGDSIVCDGCGWTWKIKDGGDDLFMCHKCGHDNTPKEETNDFFKPLQSKQSNLNISPEFTRIDYYKDYYKNLSPPDFKIDKDKNKIIIAISSNNFKPETNELDIDIIIPTTTEKTSNPLEHNAEFIEKLISLTDYMMDHINIEPLPDVNFIEDDVENAKNFFGKTAYYNPNENSITLYTYGRHPKDILRSYAHEMIHHKQNLEGKLTNVQGQNINEDDYLKELELEAYRDGNGRFFREWENSQ
jgi:hypothetical protein